MEKLQKLYANSGITLSKLSELSGVSVSTCHRYVTGKIKEKSEVYYSPIYSALEKLQYQEANSSVAINVCDLKEQMNRNTIDKIQNYQLPRVPKRGDIFYVRNQYGSGNETWGSRPAVCITNQKTFDATGNIGVCYLTSKPKYELPCHVSVKTDRSMSIVLCENIYTISKDRITKYYGRISEEELIAVENALLISLDIKHTYREKIIEVPTNAINNAQIEILKAENKMLKDFKDNLVSILSK